MLLVSSTSTVPVEAISAMIACGAAIATAASAIVTYLIYSNATQADVIVYAQQNSKHPNSLDLVIENIGRGAAKNINFQSSEPIPMHAFGLVCGEGRPATYLTDGPLIAGIPFLEPGGKRTLSWGQYGGVHDALGGRDIKISIHFETYNALLLEDKRRTVDTVLSIRSFLHSDATEDEEITRVVKSIQSVAKSITNLGGQQRRGT